MLRLIRARDLDVPVVLRTGRPSLETAIEAVEGGALRYLRKPAATAEIIETMDQAVRLGRLARWRRDALAITRPELRLREGVALRYRELKAARKKAKLAGKGP